ncbi:hypothetical protein BR93DRAFT_967487 [Coniochaeta sp. PMI_546]|nr:hypothetical protein BR93DRAFT_967487 [Coniochaeta sp. PMI_546]
MLGRLLGLSPPRAHDVWFSRNINNNQLQDWMLVVKSRKYELVRMPEGDFKLFCGREPYWTPDLERATPSPRTQGRCRREYDNWIMVNIGWSTLSGSEIDRCFAATYLPYPPRLSWTQCQEFLRRFAEQLVGRQSLHWRFLIDNTARECQSVPQLPPPPAALLQEYQQSQLQAQGQGQGQGQGQSSLARRVENFNMMQAGIMRAQQQNIALNNQLMQNR